MANASSVLNIARSQIGVKESPRNSNKQKYGKEYGMNGVPWCCEFVWWVFKHANASNLFYGGKKTAYCPTAYAHYKSKKQIVGKYNGKPGDVVFFGRCQHIGIIEKNCGNGKYITIEGNTAVGNDDNGGKVMRRTRYVSWIYAIARPKYETKPSDSYEYPTEDLEINDTGYQVVRLQKCLNKINKAGLKVDGDFGGKTKQAVINYQHKKKISADGIVGPVTRGQIKKDIQSFNLATSKVEKGVDVSWWQGNDINWLKVKKAGYTRAICRATYTSISKFALNKDSTFARNIKECYASDIKAGAYHLSQAKNKDEAIKEAKYLVKALEPYKRYITGPVVCDWEFQDRLNSNVAKSNGREKNTEIILAFIDVIKKAGYEPMVYASYSVFKNYLNINVLRKYAKIWLAQYNDTKSINDVDWWQYSSSGKVDGISTRVDVNKVYRK